MIVSFAVTALALLIAGMKFLHKSIAKVMRETVSSRGGQSYLGGTRALFAGKKAAKGEKDRCFRCVILLTPCSTWALWEGRSRSLMEPGGRSVPALCMSARDTLVNDAERCGSASKCKL